MAQFGDTQANLNVSEGTLLTMIILIKLTQQNSNLLSDATVVRTVKSVPHYTQDSVQPPSQYPTPPARPK